MKLKITPHTVNDYGDTKLFIVGFHRFISATYAGEFIQVWCESNTDDAREHSLVVTPRYVNEVFEPKPGETFLATAVQEGACSPAVHLYWRVDPLSVRVEAHHGGK